MLLVCLGAKFKPRSAAHNGVAIPSGEALVAYPRYEFGSAPPCAELADDASELRSSIAEPFGSVSFVGRPSG
jgi:hypothetical protein